MAPQRQGNDEDTNLRPQLATSLGGGASSESQGYQAENGTEAAETPSAIDGKQRSAGGKGGAEDDELTNLTWLQDCNLLQSIQASGDAKGPGLKAGPGGQSGASHDRGAAEEYDLNDGSGVGDSATSTFTAEMYDPAVHTYAKPPYSFSCLIFMAIEDSATKALPVKDIYNWILSHFPYFQNAPTGWKNSVRHNLSLNKCFLKVDKGQNIAKGSLWCVDPEYRPNLLQALRKTPYQYQHIRLPPDLRSSPSSTSAPKLISLSARPNANVPNPELFPFLSKRLAASATKDPDVDAAATMLALKNAPRIIPSPVSGQVESERPSNGAISPTKERRQKRLQDRSRLPCNLPQVLSVSLPVITMNPSEDHTYSSTSSPQHGNSDSPTSSIDEPFEFGSRDNAEQRCSGASGTGRELCPQTSVLCGGDDGTEDGGEGDSGGDSGVTHSLGSDEMDDLAEDEDDLYYTSTATRRRDQPNWEKVSPSVIATDLMKRLPSSHQQSREAAHHRAVFMEDEQKKIAEGADALLNLAGIRTQQASYSEAVRPRRRRKPSRRNLRHVIRDEAQR